MGRRVGEDPASQLHKLYACIDGPESLPRRVWNGKAVKEEVP